MSLKPVEDALAAILADAGPSEVQLLPLDRADGLVLARDLPALRTQPPADMSAMDGYAVRQADLASLPARLSVSGESAAGHPFDAPVDQGTAVRIFTGAPVPAGADTIVIQENCTREGDTITVAEPQAESRFIRRAGLDFTKGDVLLPAGNEINPRSVALAASMGHATMPVWKAPRIGILATGDELVLPGQETRDGQIIASNGFGLAAMMRRLGAEILDLGIAPDDRAEIARRIARAKDERVDVLITIGGASVGDHDHTGDAFDDAGVQLDFWKIAMRPGKPLIFGRHGDMRVLGLPGNPVSALVCARVFLLPLAAALSGRDPLSYSAVRSGTLDNDLPENDRRQDYLRAIIRETESGPRISTAHTQDSSMLATLTRSNALAVRAPFAPAAAAGSPCDFIMLEA